MRNGIVDIVQITDDHDKAAKRKVCGYHSEMLASMPALIFLFLT
jgi:hypothetical protein